MLSVAEELGLCQTQNCRSPAQGTEDWGFFGFFLGFFVFFFFSFGHMVLSLLKGYISSRTD